ncbi:MAG: NADH-quinone oxidoreductase subunit NuoE [Bacteroidetes bacterium]|nr:MAG: NADH-quinone oxidoreductase subunit NuoE [Bacteroidota bacterium]REK03428.1 MAG: NADH-quinone oxidoreductase subunit NuoE [Bacteroidota bacterium]REK34460.1 MAG: NADH-quinone oxidoreductase subunit NuoE [Bacteroidota bacterium]REK50421.1 MAG: NADH-quinone oxidoreductase subunit NuoE [Bacteroidota bacterium]
MSSDKEIKFPEETLELVRRMMKRYPEGKQKSALIPVLHLAQAEFDGWLSPQVMDYVASLLNIQSIEVYEVASFYSMFNLKPVGKCTIEVCRTSSCWLMGAEDVIRHIEKKLNIKTGQTTADGMFTLKGVECLGSCGTAPMLQVGAEYHENLTLEKVDSLLDNLRKEDKRKCYTDHFDPQSN